jgi:aspartyl-tRNA(Asn)/glutamyl-tRNA(Gln) amidotransferase subunit A
MKDEVPRLSATALAAAIRARRLSPVEVVRAVLDGIERTQPVLNAFITVCAEQALDAARDAERALLQGRDLGPLHGVPFSVKDLVATQGVRTTYGSLIFEHNVPDRDAAAVARLKAAGAILIGKTTTPEFGQKGLTEAPLFGRTSNAWRADRTCGGSSGGAAVAVAAGLAGCVQRHRRLQAKPGHRAKRCSAGCVRQHLLRHADGENGVRLCPDAGCHGRTGRAGPADA